MAEKTEKKEFNLDNEYDKLMNLLSNLPEEAEPSQLFQQMISIRLFLKDLYQRGIEHGKILTIQNNN